MRPIYFAINTDGRLAVHTEELVLSLLMVMASPEISRLISDLNSDVLLQHLLVLPLMNLLITVITEVDVIIFAVESGLFSTRLTALVEIHECFVLRCNPELYEVCGQHLMFVINHEVMSVDLI